MYFCMYFRARFLVQMFTTTVPARCLYNARRFYRRTNLPTNREIAVPCGFHSANFCSKILYMGKKGQLSKHDKFSHIVHLVRLSACYYPSPPFMQNTVLVDITLYYFLHILSPPSYFTVHIILAY
jgi:hypothetical protein